MQTVIQRILSKYILLVLSILFPPLQLFLTYFSIKDNGFKCSTCGKQDKSAIQMSQSTQSAIKYVATAPAKKLFSFDLKSEALQEFKLITKFYFDQKLEKEYKIEELF